MRCTPGEGIIAACAVYKHGKRREGELELRAARAAADAPASFAWLGLADPAEGELDEIAAEFDPHELARAGICSGARSAP